MKIEFPPPLADMRNFPDPEFSMLPTVKSRTWKAKRPFFASAETALPISYARNGLAIIAKALLTPGSKVLIPAYHCPALVEPFIWAQCDVDFFPLNADLSPNICALEAKLPLADAIVLIPYFGFKNGVASHAELARKHHCIPIEDLAHAAHANILHGDYGVTSLQKFYPVAGGGELLIANSITDTRVADCWRVNRIPQWEWTARKLSKKIFKGKGKQAETSQPSCGKFRYFDPLSIGEPMLRSDIQQINRQDHVKIATARRINYQKLDRYFNHSQLGQPLFPNLGADDVPYVYPFLLEKAEYFDLIRNMAIPLYRWEEIAPCGCETSNLYRSKLVQFPCHQDLADDDIERIISKLVTIERVVR